MIYIFEFKHKIKIGFSTNVDKRSKSVAAALYAKEENGITSKQKEKALAVVIAAGAFFLCFCNIVYIVTN